MSSGADTPEVLEMLLEDAFVLRDPEALARLFEDRAVLATGDGPGHARGAAAIVRLAMRLWERDRSYLADPRRVLQADEIGLVVAEHSINVVRRDRDGGWRYTIATLHSPTRPEGGTDDPADQSRKGADTDGSGLGGGGGALVV